MNFKLISINSMARTVLIEWADGTTLNHAIPVERLRTMIGPGKPPIRGRANARVSIEATIRRERV